MTRIQTFSRRLNILVAIIVGLAIATLVGWTIFCVGYGLAWATGHLTAASHGPELYAQAGPLAVVLTAFLPLVRTSIVIRILQNVHRLLAHYTAGEVLSVDNGVLLKNIGWWALATVLIPGPSLELVLETNGIAMSLFVVLQGWVLIHAGEVKAELDEVV